jgi:glutaminyl-peptide cyclotransferase
MTRQLACGCVAIACLVARDSCAPLIHTLTYEIVRVYPHDAAAYTEGLFYRQGYLYKGTGLEGHSRISKVRLDTGVAVLRRPGDLPRVAPYSGQSARGAG